ncbi:porin [Methylocystis sp. WRRC1]|uniref:porin n=1 Tax=Methylocystis sp. WRRC1 TaxID=1732014 RepID=UPI001D14C31F|nr:porin [Methylocystis sp. WRRC1]MCC3246568.1 porin [Methylocystis sp. WRRC1]
MMFAALRPLASSGFASASVLGAMLATFAVAPAGAETVSHCARYGSDYVAVAGSNGCVRIGGHVRVDIARTPIAPMGYAAMQDGVHHAAARAANLQPVAPFGLNDLFPR